MGDYLNVLLSHHVAVMCSSNYTLFIMSVTHLLDTVTLTSSFESKLVKGQNQIMDLKPFFADFRISDFFLFFIW